MAYVVKNIPDINGDPVPVLFDTISGQSWHLNKIVWGAEGTATPVTTGTPLPVVQTGTPALPTGAAAEHATANSPHAARLSDGAAFYQAAVEGTDITGASMPAGGASTRGWLSAIWKAITDRLPAALTGGGGVKVGLVDSIPAGANAIGTVGVTGAVDVTPPSPAAGDYLPVRLTDGSAFYNATGGGGGGGDASAANQEEEITALEAIQAATESIDAVIPAALTAGGGIKAGLVDALPAGTNAIGKLAANDGVDVGDVTVNNAAGAGVYIRPGSGVNLDTSAIEGTVAVSNFPATQPVSAASLPLPAGAATSAKQPALGTAGSASTDVLSVQGIASMTPVKTDGSATTQPVSAASLPLPAGASTSAKQPALGTAGTPSTDVISIQGVSGGTPAPVANQPLATGGCKTHRSLDLDESEEEVKATAGTVYGWAVTNTATTTRWIKFYNATAANVTVGTTTPLITWGLAGNSTDDIPANMLGGLGIEFDTAISVACTTGFADADTGAPAANDVIINVFFK